MKCIVFIAKMWSFSTLLMEFIVLGFKTLVHFKKLNCFKNSVFYKIPKISQNWYLIKFMIEILTISHNNQTYWWYKLGKYKNE